MVENANKWTKWWWVRLYQIPSWSSDERRAFWAFVVTFFVAALILTYPVLLVFNNVLELDPKKSLLIWFILMWPVTLPGLRGLTTDIFPDSVIKGDDAAAVRLSGRVYLPTNEFWIKAVWWIDLSLAEGKWSDAQGTVRERIFVIALCLFAPAFGLLSFQLMAHGINERIAALIALVTTMPPALFAGRRICISYWPALVQQADNDAIERDKKSVPPRP